jgi:hypothetical protein
MVTTTDKEARSLMAREKSGQRQKLAQFKPLARLPLDIESLNLGWLAEFYIRNVEPGVQ